MAKKTPNTALKVQEIMDPAKDALSKIKDRVEASFGKKEKIFKIEELGELKEKLKEYSSKGFDISVEASRVTANFISKKIIPKLENFLNNKNVSSKNSITITTLFELVAHEPEVVGMIKDKYEDIALQNKVILKGYNDFLNQKKSLKKSDNDNKYIKVNISDDKITPISPFTVQNLKDFEINKGVGGLMFKKGEYIPVVDDPEFDNEKYLNNYIANEITRFKKIYYEDVLAPAIEGILDKRISGHQRK